MKLIDVVILVIIASISVKCKTHSGENQLGFYFLDDQKNYNLTWQDKGCIPPTTVSVYKVVDIDGYFTLGDYVQPNYEEPGSFKTWQQPYGPSIAIREVDLGFERIKDTPLLLQISDAVKVWDSSQYSANTNITIWRPISPDDDYMVLGDVASLGIDTQPDLSNIVAVHKSCVTICESSTLLWSSESAEGQPNALIYAISSPSYNAVTGTFFTVVTHGNEPRVTTKWPCLLKQCLNTRDPQQIHIATGTDITTYTINWVTLERTAQSLIRYGFNENQLTQLQQGTNYVFTDGGLQRRQEIFHQVTITDLEENTTYYYQVGDPKFGWSPVYSFTTYAKNREVLRMAVYGDLGYENSQSLQLLKNEVINSKSFDLILHVGDFAYNMDDHNGQRGDNFMRMVEPIAGRVPYHVCVGNHEFAYNFSHYVNRFDNMPFKQSASSTALYYSWDYSLVHFVAFSTEAYFSTPMDLGLIQAQYNWLINDLSSVNRTQTPWVILFGHRPMYCSDVTLMKRRNWKNVDEFTDCTSDTELVRVGPNGKFGMEKLMGTYGVDLYMTAHEHSYERLYPVYNRQVTGKSYINPTAPVHIISGSAGCSEGLETFGPPYGPWSAFRSSTYGYGRMTVFNATHLHWEQILDSANQVLDEITLVQEHHGSFL